MRVGRFLKYQIVAVETERIAGEFERDVVVTAERQTMKRLAYPQRQFRRELNTAGGEHRGRHRDNAGARGNRASWCLNNDGAVDAN